MTGNVDITEQLDISIPDCLATVTVFASGLMFVETQRYSIRQLEACAMRVSHVLGFLTAGIDDTALQAER